VTAPAFLLPQKVQEASMQRQQSRSSNTGIIANLGPMADDFLMHFEAAGEPEQPWASIRTAGPDEYGKYVYPDYPAKTPATLARYFRKNEPDYYAAVRQHVEAHGVQEPVLLRYRDGGGHPLKKPVVMGGHHRAAAAWELGQSLPVGDYDNPEHYEASNTGFAQQWWRDHSALKEQYTDPRTRTAAVRPGRGEKACLCCKGSGSHNDGSECDQCDESGLLHSNEEQRYCPGQPQPRRRRWREPVTGSFEDAEPEARQARFDRAREWLERNTDAHSGTVDIPAHWGHHVDNQTIHHILDTHGWPRDESDREDHWSHIEPENFPVHQPIHQHQGFVWPGGVEDKMIGAMEDSRPWDDQPAKIVRHEGNSYLLDGHHKLAGARLLGQDSIEAHVFDTSKPETYPEHCRECQDEGVEMTRRPETAHTAARPGYQGQHHPLSWNAPMHATEDAPGFYGDPGRHTYGEGADETLDQFRKARGNPDHPVRIYRTMPLHAGGTINTGDWVSLGREAPLDLAEQRNYHDPDSLFTDPLPDHSRYHTYEATVPARHVRNGGDMMEWGYWGDPVQGEHSPGCCDQHTAGLDVSASAGDEPSSDYKDLLGHFEAADSSVYHGVHIPPGGPEDDPEWASPMHDVRNAMPRAYAGWDAESGRQLQASEGKPDHPVTVYRALPADRREFNTGDWVTTSGAYARQHGESNLRHAPWHVVRADVPARHLFNEGYMTEWGYQGPHIANPAVHYVGHDHDRREASLEAEASGDDYRLTHGAPGPQSGHLPLHHYTGEDPDSHVRVYRSAPAGTESINTGDWVSLNPAYAHRHGYGEARDGGNWPVYTAEVPQRHVHWDENDPDEHGYNGPALHHPDVHDEETGALHDWDDYHEAHPHGQEAWLGGSVHLPVAEHDFAHDEFEWEPDRADTVLSAAREQGALHNARWRDDIYPAREDAEGHAAQHLGAVPEGHRLTAFTVHRNDAGAIDDIGLHHYEPSDDPYVRRPYAFADLSEHNYSHPAVEEAGRGHQAAYEPLSREYSSGRMLVSDIRRPGGGLLSERPYTQRQMAADIRRNGVEQPLAIEHTTAYGGNPTVINGLHRLDGAQRAGIADVPVVVKHLPGRLPPMLSREPATEQEFNDAYDTERSGRWAGEPGLTAEAEVLEPSKRIRRRAVRQRDGDERSFGEYTMRYRTTDEGERRPRHVIEVFHPDSDQPVGKLSWRGSTRKVESIDVSGPHQRKGLATAMWGWSQEMSPKARHSDDQTDQGKAWVKSLSAHGASSSTPATAALEPGAEDSGISVEHHETFSGGATYPNLHTFTARHPDGTEAQLSYMLSKRNARGVVDRAYIPKDHAQSLGVPLVQAARRLHPGVFVRGMPGLDEDWGQHLPSVTSLHRNLTIKLEPADRAYVHDESVPRAHRARFLMDLMARSGPSMHWASQRGQVAAEESFGDHEFRSPEHTQISLSASPPSAEHVETDPERISRNGGYAYQAPDWEVPLKEGAPVNVGSIRWRTGTAGWTQHRFRSGHQFTAGVHPAELASAPARTAQLAVRPAEQISVISSWIPENNAQVQEMLDDFPLLFIALADGLTSLAARIDGPVDERIPGALTAMAAACQSAAEDARDTAARAHETAGAWHAS